MVFSDKCVTIDWAVLFFADKCLRKLDYKRLDLGSWEEWVRFICTRASKRKNIQPQMAWPTLEPLRLAQTPTVIWISSGLYSRPGHTQAPIPPTNLNLCPRCRRRGSRTYRWRIVQAGQRKVIFSNVAVLGFDIILRFDDLGGVALHFSSNPIQVDFHAWVSPWIWFD